MELADLSTMEKLVTDSIGKAEVLNTQFQSAFTQDPDGDPQ